MFMCVNEHSFKEPDSILNKCIKPKGDAMELTQKTKQNKKHFCHEKLHKFWWWNNSWERAWNRWFTFSNIFILSLINFSLTWAMLLLYAYYFSTKIIRVGQLLKTIVQLPKTQLWHLHIYKKTTTGKLQRVYTRLI